MEWWFRWHFSAGSCSRQNGFFYTTTIWIDACEGKFLIKNIVFLRIEPVALTAHEKKTKNLFLQDLTYDGRINLIQYWMILYEVRKKSFHRGAVYISKKAYLAYLNLICLIPIRMNAIIGWNAVFFTGISGRLIYYVVLHLCFHLCCRVFLFLLLQFFSSFPLQELIYDLRIQKNPILISIVTSWNP